MKPWRAAYKEHRASIQSKYEESMRRLLVFLFLGATTILATGCGSKPPPAKRFKMGMMPKIKSIDYFKACAKGAQEAAAELDIDLLYDGPAKDDVNEQVAMLDQWIAQDFDCIAIAPNDPQIIVPALGRARGKGITVLTFDADADNFRQFFINQASYESIAKALVDTMAKEIRGDGKVGILTSTLQAPNQSEWARRMRAYREERYPSIEFLDEVESQENSQVGLDRAKGMIQAHPDLKGIIGLTSIACPAAADAVDQLGMKGKVHVVGLSMPNKMRKFIKNGTVETVILWKPVDLGYLTVQVANLVRKGEMAHAGKIKAGRLGEVEVRDNGEVILGPPLRFTAQNIDEYDF
jgi:ABC-type sugar transport system substrate-binding protein